MAQEKLAKKPARPIDDQVVEENVRRVARLLRSAVQFLGVSHRQIERSMGLSTGYLSRIFSGKVELRVEHVLGVCTAINLPPAAFFEAAFPVRDFDRDTARLVAALRELMPETEAVQALRVLTDDRARTQERLAERARIASRIVEVVLQSMDEDQILRDLKPEK